MRPLYDSVEFLDQRCYRSYHMSEELLMEHAALAMARELEGALPDKSRVLIVCGPGNNGADGLALARLLAARFVPAVYLPLGASSPLCRVQLERVRALGIAVVETPGEAEAIVDALFGSGGRLPDTATIPILERLNRQGGFKLACDIPTGITRQGVGPVVFRADVTVTMGADKTALYHDGAKPYTGRIVVASLGVAPRDYADATAMGVMEEGDLALPLRHDPVAHKGSFGHVAVMMGDKPGAAELAARAALAFGAGLVTVVSPRAAPLPPDVMNSRAVPSGANVLVAGMGLGTGEAARQAFAALEGGIAAVVDADMFDTPHIVPVLSRSAPTVITPHPKEFAALLRRSGLGDWSVEAIQNDRFAAARLFAAAYPTVVLLLKGATTLIVRGERLRVNPLGNVALAKGGSGDVLAGLIGALMAQGYDPYEAAVQASLAHALAAGAYRGNNYALTPSLLIEEIRCL